LGYAVAQKEAEISPEGDVAPPQANCDEVCAAQVAESITRSNIQVAKAQEAFNLVKYQLDTAEGKIAQGAHDSAAEIEVLKVEIDSLKNQLGSSETAVDEIKKMLENSNAEAKTYQDGMAENAATAAKKIAALWADLAAAKAEAAEFSGSRFFINVGLIKADIRAYLKKLGLLKD
jgi:chromosome segregation ATPase